MDDPRPPQDDAPRAPEDQPDPGDTLHEEIERLKQEAEHVRELEERDRLARHKYLDSDHALADHEPAHRLVYRAFSTIHPESVRWLWKPRIPLRSVTLLAGRQGLGKSTLTAMLAAGVSLGQCDGDLKGDPAHVLLVSYEDDAATTLAPRIQAAGADLSRVVLVEQQEGQDLVSLPGDLADIEAMALGLKARLLIIDPIVASLPSTIDAHRDQDVRRALAPLAALAARCDLAALGLIHWNKSVSTDALSRVSGSTAFTAAARSMLAFGTDQRDPQAEDDGLRILAHAKSNLGPRATSVSYEIEPTTIKGDFGEIETVRLTQRGETNVTASQLLMQGETQGEQNRLEEAKAFLLDELGDGAWHKKEELLERAKSDRLSRRTLLRAFNELGGEFDRRGFPSKGVWRLPKAVQTLFEEGS